MRTSLLLAMLVLGCVGFGCALGLSSGCSVPPAPPADMSLRAVGDHRCLGADDVGHVMWWSGFGEPMERQTDFDDKRYVCVDHGPGRHGYWYEMIPEER
jgi:hypothetical protein